MMGILIKNMSVAKSRIRKFVVIAMETVLLTDYQGFTDGY